MPRPGWIRSPRRLAWLAACAACVACIALAGAAAAREVPELAEPDVFTGKSVVLSALAGKPVLLCFWSLADAPSRAAFPALVRLHQRWAPRLAVVAASIDASSGESISAAWTFANGLKARFPVVFAGAGTDARYRVLAEKARAEGRLPYALLVGPAGEYLGGLAGDLAPLEFLVASTLGEPVPAPALAGIDAASGRPFTLPARPAAPVLVVFLGPGPGAARSAAVLARLAADFAGRAAVLAVAGSDDAAAARRFAGDTRLPCLLPAAGARAAWGPLDALPCAYVVDTAGRVARRVVGARSYDEYAALVAPHVR